MDFTQLSDFGKTILTEFFTETIGLGGKYKFTPEFVVYNLTRYMALKEVNLATKYNITITYKTFIENNDEYGCIIFQHLTGLKYLSDPLFINNVYRRGNAYNPTPFTKFRKRELDLFLIKNTDCIGMDSQEFIKIYRQYLLSINQNFRLMVHDNNIIIDGKYSRKIFENGKVKEFIVCCDNMSHEAKII